MRRSSLYQTLCPLLAAVALAAMTAPANAATFAFSGAESNDTPTPGPSASCGAGQVLVSFSPTTATTSGTSNFGNFGPTMTHCLTPPPASFSYSGGVFDFAFDAGDDLTGTYSGNFTPTSTPGLLNTFIDYVVTGGTGRFLDASGAFEAVGTLDKRPIRPLNNVTFSGELNLPAVPEPATWTLMLLGFGSLGAMLRRGRQALA